MPRQYQRNNLQTVTCLRCGKEIVVVNDLPPARCPHCFNYNYDSPPPRDVGVVSKGRRKRGQET